LAQVPAKFNGVSINYATFTPSGDYLYGWADSGFTERIVRYDVNRKILESVFQQSSSIGGNLESMQAGIDGNIYH
jgi:hypothetical protein